MKNMLVLGLAMVFSFTTMAQSGNHVPSDKEITWLGLDFTQVKYIGTAAQWKDVGDITSANLRDKYFPAWNSLFINEQKKFDVAGALNRTEVAYALSVTEKANNSIKGDLFSEDPSEYTHLEEANIQKLVSKYDFQGKNGIGLLFFIESMSKGKEEATGWITFVDMDRKKVLVTERVSGKAGGFGFRNYWAKSFLNMLKESKRVMKS